MPTRALVFTEIFKCAVNVMTTLFETKLTFQLESDLCCHESPFYGKMHLKSKQNEMSTTAEQNKTKIE